MAQFEVAVTDTTGRGAGFMSALTANALAAADIWSSYLVGQGTISVQINIVELSSDQANGHSPTMAFDHVSNGIAIYEPGAAHELRTGVDSTPVGPDIEINVDPDYVFNWLWLDPNPGAINPIVPGNRLDAVSMFMHEMAHALAFDGWHDWATGVLPPGSVMSPYDENVVLSGGHRYFVGANAQAVYGGPVMLTDGIYLHYGNTPGWLNTDLTHGLMNGVYFISGRRFEISELDLAILQDSGLQVMTDRDDALAGFASNDTIHGRGGNDVVDGAGGNDSLWGDIGSDVLRGGANDDELHGGFGSDWIEGETGNDPFAGVAGNDTIFGDDGDDIVLAGDGNDLVYGGSGTDALVGEGGNDVMYGEGDWDLMDGRAGTDDLHGGAGADIIFGDAGADRIFGDEGDDLIMGERGENVTIGDNDTIWGGNGNDMLDGSAGDDIILGEQGNDIIDGDDGNDLIVGGPGAEIIAGSAYNGVTGQDQFIYLAMSDAGDSIYGFRTTAGNNDYINLVVLFDSIGYTGGNPRVDGHLLVQESGGNTYVYVDPNGPAGGANWTPFVTLVGTSLSTGGLISIDSYFFYQ
jgi:Ca2+-binding RTX toxin-like protein